MGALKVLGGTLKFLGGAFLEVLRGDVGSLKVPGGAELLLVVGRDAPP